MAIHELVVNGTQYNCAEAPATKQKELLHILAARLTYNVGKDADVDLDDNFMFGALMGISESDFDNISKIVLYKCVENGGDTLVDIGNFQGNITSYYMLVAKAVTANIADFIAWLDDARKPQAQPVAESIKAISTGN